MFVRLTRRMRAKAGWFVAMLYLLCIVAPGAALALGNPAPWLPAEIKPAVAAPSHEHMDHAHMHHGDSSDDQGGMQTDRHSDAGHNNHQHDGKASPGPCCAMLGLSAIAVDLPAIANPVQPTSRCASEKKRRLPGKAPPLLYRPPIA
jgi:hypothetical protein